MADPEIYLAVDNSSGSPTTTYVDQNKTTFGGGGGGGPVEPGVTLKDYVDAQSNALESRVNQKLERLPTKGTVWGAVATGVGILLAVLAFGGDRFDSGISANGLLKAQSDQQDAVDRRQDQKLESIDKKLDIIIQRNGKS